MKLTFYNRPDEIRDQTQYCQKKGHVQQVAYSTYHNGITQVCFACNEVRTNIGPPYLTPIDDKLEDGEREGACIFCGMRREDRRPCTGHIEHHFSREKRATSTKQDKPEKIEMPIDDEPSWKDLRDWMKSVTNWINNHEKEE